MAWRSTPCRAHLLGQRLRRRDLLRQPGRLRRWRSQHRRGHGQHPVGMAIDPSARRLYWANEVGNRISFADLDGGGGGDMSTPGATVNGSRSAALLKAPSGSSRRRSPAARRPAPCSHARRALVAGPARLQPLPRAPEHHLSWSLNGADIPGAGANIIHGGGGPAIIAAGSQPPTRPAAPRRRAPLTGYRRRRDSSSAPRRW